jgi:WD40 repeat protein
MKKVIMLLFFSISAQVGDENELSVTSNDGNWLAESSGDNCVKIFWVGDAGRFKVRTIAISQKNFSGGNKDESMVNALLWSEDRRYLAIGSKGGVDVWDTNYQCFVETALSEEIVGLRAKCLEKQLSVSKVKSLKAHFEKMAKKQ